MAAGLESNDGVYFVPALTGLGSPWWDPYARGAIVGLTRGTGREQIALAALESIAYQTLDAVKAQELASGKRLSALRADGGAVANRWLMQFQADILGAPVIVPEISETTALGAARLCQRVTSVVLVSGARVAARVAALADPADGVAPLDPPAPFGLDLLEVGETGLETAAMIDQNGPPVAAVPAGNHDSAVRGGPYQSAPRGREINALVPRAAARHSELGAHHDLGRSHRPPGRDPHLGLSLLSRCAGLQDQSAPENHEPTRPPSHGRS